MTSHAFDDAEIFLINRKESPPIRAFAERPRAVAERAGSRSRSGALSPPGFATVR
jgi:hypothetical protein